MEVVVKEDNGKVVAELIVSAVDRALEKIGLVAEGHAIGYETAVDTGSLRNSITHSVNSGEKSVIIGTNVEYAPYIEMGHHGGKFKGIHFLRRAAEGHVEEYRQILEEELKNP